jgi:pilus assembly protein CpaE
LEVILSSRVVVVSLGGTAADQLERVLVRNGLTVAVVRDLGSAVPIFASAQMIIAEAGDRASLAMLCRRINDEAGANRPPVLAVVGSRDVETRVSMLEAGADDVLAQPVDERELEALVEALLLRSNASSRPASPIAPPVPRPEGSLGRLIVFGAAKGGSGTTTLAVNVAVTLAEMAPGNVAIADLDMVHGQVAAHLDIYGRSSTAQLAREDLTMTPAEVIAEAGKQHPSGLMVFGGPYRPDDAYDVSADQLGALLTALRSLYGTVIVDAGSMIDARAGAIIDRADRVCLVVTPDIPALRLLRAALEMLSDMGGAADRAIFVINEIYPKTPITADQIEEHVGVKVSLQVPYDSENFLRAVNEGQPLVGMARRSAAATALKKLAELLAETGAEGGEVRATKKGRRLGGLLGR